MQPSGLEKETSIIKNDKTYLPQPIHGKSD